MRHFVPVDGEARAREIGGAGDAHAAAFGELAEFFFPIGDFHDAANAFGKIDGAQAEIICGDGIGSFDDAEAQVGGVELEFFGNFVELDFLAEARLDGAMAAFGAAGRLVGEGAAALKAVARDVVGGGLQRAGVKGAGDAVGAVAAAVDQRLEMHSGDGAVFFDAGFEFHQDGMAAAVAIENFFAREADLDGAIEHAARPWLRRFRD